MISDTVSDWLREAPEAYIRYLVYQFLEPEKADRNALENDPFIRENIETLHKSRTDVLKQHNKPGLAMHRLAMLADLGVSIETPGIEEIAESLLSSMSDSGEFLTPMEIPKAFGGPGVPRPDWIICDFPVILYALKKIGVDDKRLNKAESRLVELAGEDYYPCCGSIPKFKGPGPRGGMCPYANLLVARALSVSTEGRSTESALKAAEAVLSHWENRKEKKYFLFGMGTDFKKLKFPFVWYNILHVLYALKSIPGVIDDSRYREMQSVLEGKLDSDGKLIPESIYMIYKKEEWSNKKEPSRLMTLLGYSVLR